MSRHEWRGAAAMCIVCLAMALTATAAYVGPDFSSGDPADDREAIRAHIDRIFKAYIAKDRHEVQVTHDKEWRGFLTGSHSIIKGIDDYMRAADTSLRSTTGGMLRYDMQQFDVQFRGDDIAIVPYVADVTGRYDGVERNYTLRVLDVYERQGGEWMQIASNTALHPQSISEQTSELQTLAPSQRAELLKAREAVWRAWFSGDETTLRKVLPPETIALAAGPDGWTSREEIIKASREFAASGGKLVSLEFPRTDIQVYGATAIIYTSYIFGTETAGKAASERGTAVEIFVRRPNGWVNSGWQLLADRSSQRMAVSLQRQPNRGTALDG